VNISHNLKHYQVQVDQIHAHMQKYIYVAEDYTNGALANAQEPLLSNARPG